MKIAIVVLNWNGEKYISKCLTSLNKLKKDNHEVKTIVVDGGSTDNSVALIKNKFPNVTLIEKKENLGYAGGNNVGIKYALDNNFDLVWIVNPDVWVDPNSLVNLVKIMVNDDKIGASGSKVYFAPGFEFHKDRYSPNQIGKVLWFAGGKMDWNNVFSVHAGMDEVDQGQFDQPGEVEFLTGSSMLLSCKALRDVGLLNNDYFLYYEETDLCMRLLKNGYKLMYVPQSVVWHANAQATGAGSGLVDYYTTRNRMVFGMTWAPLKTKVALLKESLGLLFKGRSWQKKAILDYYLGVKGKGSYEA